MSQQQEMGYNETQREEPFYSGGYEGSYQRPQYGQKLNVIPSHAPSSLQRLLLALASLTTLMLLIFGLIAVSIVEHAASWVAIPFFLILCLFTAAVIVINVVFNRSH